MVEDDVSLLGLCPDTARHGLADACDPTTAASAAADSNGGNTNNVSITTTTTSAGQAECRLRLLRILLQASEKTAARTLAVAVQKCGPAPVFALLMRDALNLSDARRLSLRAGALLEVLAEGEGLMRLPASTASSVVAMLVKEYITAVAWPSSHGSAPSLPRLPVGLAHRYGWLDNLPPLTFGHCPGPGASASVLSQLRQLQALICRYLTPATAEALRLAIEDSCGGEDYPGRAALRLLCWPLCGRYVEAMAFILCGNPALAAEYVSHCIRVGWMTAEEAWATALGLATPFCETLGRLGKGDHTDAAVTALAKDGAVPEALRQVLASGAAVSVPGRAEFLSAFKAMLREAALTLSMLPGKGGFREKASGSGSAGKKIAA
jgi:hypothetical protein